MWLSACLGFAATAFAQDAEFTAQLIKSRLMDLRISGVAARDETVKAYESAQSFLRQAVSHDRDAASYVDALTAAPRRESEIQLRMDAFEVAESPPISFSGLSLQEQGEQIRLTRAELLEAKKARDRIDRRLSNRETNAKLNRSRLGNIVTRLGELADLDVRIDRQAPPSLDEGLQWSALAEQIALNAVFPSGRVGNGCTHQHD